MENLDPKSYIPADYVCTKMVNMRKFGLKGIAVPMVTPFKSDKRQDVDEEKLRSLVNFLIDQGVHCLIPCGGTGESVRLSPEENKRVIEITVDETRRRVPVIGGAKSAGTRNSVDLAKGALEAGADGALVVGPYYDKHTEEGYYTHFKTVAEEVDIPILIYNLPRMHGEDLPLSVIARLAESDSFIGLKNSTENLLHITEAITICKEKGISYMQGQAALFLPCLHLGAQGSITSIVNAVPSIFVELYDSFVKGQWNRARELHFQMLPLFKLGGSPVTVKAALELIGHPMGPPRKPLLLANENQTARIKDALKKLGMETVG